MTVKTKHPHVPAAFINALREEGTKEEVCNFLQEQWNETCALHKQNKALLDALQSVVDDLVSGLDSEAISALETAKEALTSVESTA